jgi:hypothetical protein
VRSRGPQSHCRARVAPDAPVERLQKVLSRSTYDSSATLPVGLYDQIVRRFSELSASVVLVGFAQAGCYTSAIVPAQSVAGLGTGLASNGSVVTIEHGPTTLRPSTAVRIRGRQGKDSAWHDGGDLWILPEGVATGLVRRLDEAREAFVSDLAPTDVQRLRALAPVGGGIAVGDGRQTIVTTMMSEDDATHYVSRLRDARWLRLTAPSSASLLSWVGAFLAETPIGSWELLDGRHAPLASALPGDVLVRAGVGRRSVLVADGMRWSDIDAFEIRAPDPLPTLLAAIPIVPLLVLAALAVSSTGGEVHGTTSDSETPPGGSDTAFTVACDEPCTTRGSPLFTARARRRGYVRGLAEVEAAGDVNGGVRAGATAGVRLYDNYDLALTMRDQSSKANETRTDRAALGLMMGLQAPLSEASRWALAFGIGAGATLPAPHLFLMDFSLGLRRAFGEDWFVGVPVVASFQEAVAHTGGGSWSIGLGGQIGVAW